MYYNYKTYPSPNSKSVIFFAAPFGFKIKQLQWAIHSLQKEGFTVVAYDAEEQILTLGDPKLLEQTVYKIAKDIKEQIKAYKSGGFNDFGFFGSSIGAFMMYYCTATIADLRWGVLNTGGDAVAAIWKKRELRELHEENGMSKEALEKMWHKIQHPKFRHMHGKKILFVSSTKDQLLPRSEIDPYIEPMIKAGGEVKILELNIWRHSFTVLFGLVQAKKLVRTIHMAKE